ncbi:MAG: histidine phosphatase family protein [Mycobacteriales bacterium]
MSGVGWPQRLWFVRHAESLGNVANAAARKSHALRLEIESSDSQIGLSDHGVGQARALGRWMRALPADDQPTRIVVSPYLRTRETARLLVTEAALEAVPLTMDERLRDREQGVLDRLTAAGFREQYAAEAERRDYVGKFWFRPAGGESWADVALRLRAALLDIRLNMPGERVLIVTHDVVILLARYILEQLAPEEATGWSGQLHNCSLTAFQRVGDGMDLDCFNDISPIAAVGLGAAHG